MDAVEIQIRRHMERIPAILAGARSSQSIRQIAGALNHHTNTPWSVIFAVQHLESLGLVRRNTPRNARSPFRWRLKEAE